MLMTNLNAELGQLIGQSNHTPLHLLFYPLNWVAGGATLSRFS